MKNCFLYKDLENIFIKQFNLHNKFNSSEMLVIYHNLNLPNKVKRIPYYKVSTDDFRQGEIKFIFRVNGFLFSTWIYFYDDDDSSPLFLENKKYSFRLIGVE